MGAYLTLATMRQEFSEKIGDWLSGTTTGAGSTTTAVDSGLASLSYLPTDALKNFFILLTSGTYSGSVRPISAFNSSNGTITWQTALAGASGSSVTYEIHRIDPRWKLAALNMARRRASDYLWRPIVDFGVITGSRVFNGGFAHWDSGLPLGWTKSNASLTVTRGVGQHGQQVRLTGAYNLWNTLPHLADSLSLAGESITLYATVYATAASEARIGLVDSSTTTYSSYHTGNSRFAELDTGAISIPAGNYLFRPSLYAGAAESWFENVYTKGGPKMYAYPVPSAFFEAPTRIELCNKSGTENERISSAGYHALTGWHLSTMSAFDAGSNLITIGHIVFGPAYAPASGYRMKWYGKGLLSSVSVDTDTMEVDNNTAPYLYAWAKHLLGLRLESGPAPREVRERYKGLADEGWDEKEAMERSGKHLSPAAPSGTFPAMSW